jgi:hypothetical protein
MGTDLEYFEGRWHDRDALLSRLTAMEASHTLAPAGEGMLAKLRPPVVAYYVPARTVDDSFLPGQIVAGKVIAAPDADPTVGLSDFGKWHHARGIVRVPLGPERDALFNEYLDDVFEAALADDTTDETVDESTDESLDESADETADESLDDSQDDSVDLDPADDEEDDEDEDEPKRVPATATAGEIEARRLRGAVLDINTSGQYVLAAAAGDELPTFNMTAYTGGPMQLTGFNYPVVIDLTGLQTKQVVPALRDHDPAKVVGHTRSVSVGTSKIKAEGIVSGGGKSATEVVESGRASFPWQVSVGASVQRIEFVPAGRSATVNGATVSGPVNVARRSTLRELSFVAMGADDNTAGTIAGTAAVHAADDTDGGQADGE